MNRALAVRLPALSRSASAFRQASSVASNALRLPALFGWRRYRGSLMLSAFSQTLMVLRAKPVHLAIR